MRQLPENKTLGTGYNLRPTTESVPAAALRVGQVVLETTEYPAVITHIRPNGKALVVRARYVWSATHEPDWPLGTFHAAHPFDRAVKGEY